MGKKASKELPLEAAIYVVNLAAEEQHVVVERRRGFMRDMDIRKIQRQRQNGPWKQNGMAELTALADSLRAHLDAAGLPTDTCPVQPLELDTGYDPDDHGFPQDDDLWIDYAIEATEPLTKDRIAANLLHATNRLLANLTDDQLSEVFSAMQLYHLNELVGDLNQTAALGANARTGRAKGPEAKKARGQRVREIVKAAAQDFWSEKPAFKGDPDKTAQMIFHVVNAAREKERLGKPLSVKTIYNYLWEMSREGKLQQ